MLEVNYTEHFALHGFHISYLRSLSHWEIREVWNDDWVLHLPYNFVCIIICNRAIVMTCSYYGFIKSLASLDLVASSLYFVSM